MILEFFSFPKTNQAEAEIINDGILGARLRVSSLRPYKAILMIACDILIWFFNFIRRKWIRFGALIFD